MPTIAVLGLGAMGSRMATRLLDAGHAVIVYNRTPERAEALEARGARRGAAAAEAVAAADVVISMLRDDGASRDVWLGGAADALPADAVVIESSTLTPTWARELAGIVEAQGARFLDAPVVGTRPHAEAGRLVYLVGGDPSVLDGVRPILEPLAGAIHSVGPTGAGMAMKLAVNALFGIQAAALAELLGYLQRSGFAPEAALDTLAALPVTSPAAARVGALMTGDTFAPNFPIELVAKDFRYAHAAAEAVGAEVPLARAAGRVFADAEQDGLGHDDIAGIIQPYR